MNPWKLVGGVYLEDPFTMLVEGREGGREGGEGRGGRGGWG